MGLSIKPNRVSMGEATRQAWGSTGDKRRDTNVTGMYIGQVMDDRDEQFQGRLWVYIPELSAERFDPHTVPSFGGTTPDRQFVDGLQLDDKLRMGWFLVSGISPMGGSDSFRGGIGGDGRQANGGDVNSYGMWSQPRIGDHVAIMFNGGDTNSGYWIGCVPKPFENAMVPGTPGTPRDNVSDRDGSGYAAQTGEQSSLPTMSRTSSGGSIDNDDQVLATELAQNITRSGVSADPIRGAGSSGSRRESPSYVTGIKTPGWNYESEKNNRDMDGTRFSERMEELSTRDATGHSLTMDDHPDSQLMRLRSSSGAQILINDSGENPFIYISTQTGGTWIEFSDDGEIMMYAEKGIHMTSEGDFNLTVKDDFNLEVGGNMTTVVYGDKAEQIGGDDSSSVSGDRKASVTGDEALRVGGYAAITASDDLDLFVGGDFVTSTLGENHNTVGGASFVTLKGDYDMVTTGNMRYSITGNEQKAVTGDQGIQIDGNICSGVGGNVDETIGGTHTETASGPINLDGSTVNINSGNTAAECTLDEVVEAEAAEISPIPNQIELNATPASPSASERNGNGATGQEETVAPVVPRHQPWDRRSEFGSTAGTNTTVTPAPVGGTVTPGCTSTDVTAHTRDGAVRENEVKPLPSVGGTSESGTEPDPVFVPSNDYTGTNPAEKPTFKGAIAFHPGDIGFVSDMQFSNQHRTFISRMATQAKVPIFNKVLGKHIAGFGKIVDDVDELIGSLSDVPFLSKFIPTDLGSKFSSFSSSVEKMVEIPLDKAEEFLTSELSQVESFMESQFAEIEMTQKMFDTIGGFIHNIGIDKLQSLDKGIDLIEQIKTGNFDKVSNIMMEHAYVGSSVDCSVLARRRSEVTRMHSPSGRNQALQRDIEYTYTGEPVVIGPYKIAPAVYQALVNANKKLVGKAPAGYFFGICAQESGFNPNAMPRDKNGNPLSSAGGLFQFIKSTGARYGISKSRAAGAPVFDPVINANAGAEFMLDNYDVLAGWFGTNLSRTDHYLAHFLGTGSVKRDNGAYGFIRNTNQNPSAIAAHHSSFKAAAKANRFIFYSKGVALPFSQVYAKIEAKIEKRCKYFLDL